MTNVKAHSGFHGGVQAHSQGEHYPITEYTCGGWPPNNEEAYFVVQHPCGTKRRCWTLERRNLLMDTFLEAHKATQGLDANVVDERVAFELALHALELKGRWVGFSFEGSPR